ncbi:MAG: YlbF family regulator [Lactobacillus sp.]|jgi:cell fate (sporulation/competence/biofilm development) regulator YlbF (YheA/YmcA/DUF963 family)|nr:YlbF family regulator [Lactobacillus sp.]MCH3990401.1 YlbF family regulator [Lactobacillus sp.]MCH4068884.1 YlbF family regulator [Lactobacillus sp.]MCI1481054.1 YlbF family regulator [Lactobacillus sp.]MCI1943089.1 YlbF family regulator [Lactobacillus sp.]
MMDKEIEATAKKLAEQLKESHEYKSLAGAVALVKNDEQTVALYKRMDLLQKQLMAKQAQGQKPTEEEVNEYKSIEQKLGQNPTMANLLKEEKRVYALLNKLQTQMTMPIGELYQELVK